MAFFADKKRGRGRTQKWGVRGRTVGEKDKQKEQKYKWSKQKNLHFRLCQKKKTDAKKRFLAFFSAF